MAVAERHIAAAAVEYKSDILPSSGDYEDARLPDHDGVGSIQDAAGAICNLGMMRHQRYHQQKSF